MKLVACDASHLSVIIDLTKKIWPIAYGDILTRSQLDYMIDTFYTETALHELMVKGHVFCLAQDEKDCYVGFVSYEINCEPTKTKIHKIYVLPELQGAGLGRYFFEWVKTKAIDNKQKTIFLNVNKNNKARFFYEKLGFSQVKEEVIAIGQGYVMDDYVMEITI
jgi:ribosomal protein S18 acetylase RimI-like enzyme